MRVAAVGGPVGRGVAVVVGTIVVGGSGMVERWKLWKFYLSLGKRVPYWRNGVGE